MTKIYDISCTTEQTKIPFICQGLLTDHPSVGSPTVVTGPVPVTPTGTYKRHPVPEVVVDILETEFSVETRRDREVTRRVN